MVLNIPKPVTLYTAPHAAVNSNHKIIPMLLHATVKNHDVDNVISAFFNGFRLPS